MGNIVFFVDLKAINRGKDDKRRLCQNVGTTFFYNLSSCYLFFCLRRFFLIHLVTSCYIPVVSGYK